ncbi:MAG: hypothetical protein ACE5DM_01575 [Candidatus Nanoarchaeia archaeon]
MVLGLLSRKNRTKEIDSRLVIFSTKVSDAFARLKQDISIADRRMAGNEAELSKLNQWVGYLYQSQQDLHHKHSSLSDKHSKLHQEHSKLSRSHSSMSKSIDLKHAQVQSDIAGVHTLTKKEVESLKAWIAHFSGKIDNQRDIEAKLRKDVLSIQSQLYGVLSEFRQEISNMKSENKDLKEKVSALEHEPKPHLVPEPKTQVVHEEPVFPANNRFEQKILARIRPNRKNYVMQQILELIEDKTFSTREVEDIIVGEKQFCGRTSFYSYLRELKHRGKINYADIGEKTVLVAVK